jgi:DNA polymerase III subunit chi
MTMPQVEFHILNEAGDNARLRYACQLIEQAHGQGQRAYVYTASDAEAQRMDEVLWTFRDQAFIPHELLSDASPTHPCIMAVIGSSAAAPAEFSSLLINLSNLVPTTTASFIRICEVIDADPQRKQQARERYRQYRQQGCQLEMKDQ